MVYFIESLRTFWFLNSYFMRNRYYSLFGSSLHNSKPLSLIHPNVCAGNAFPTFSVHLILLSIAQLISPPPWSLPQLLQPTEMYFSELQHLLYNHLLMIFLTDIKPAFTIRIKYFLRTKEPIYQMNISTSICINL